MFALTRGLGILAGLRLHSEWLADYFQVLDIAVLKDHLLSALLYLHAQPPVFNAIVGLAEKLGEAHASLALAGFQLLLGLASSLAVYMTLVTLRVRSGLALMASLALMLNPAAIGYEFDPLYTEIVYSLLCFLALATARFIRYKRASSLYWLAAASVCLTLTRATYSFIWVAAIMLVLWLAVTENRRQIMKVGLVAVLVVLLWPAKNYIVFHHFASSTWVSYSMARHWEIGKDAPMVDQEALSNGQLFTFAHREDDGQGAFRAWLGENWPVKASGHPELDRIQKQGGGTNWNSLSMLRMHDAQAQEVKFLLRHDPQTYLKAVTRGVSIYFQPTSDYLWYLNKSSYLQYQHIAPADRAVKRICCNIFGLPDDGGLSRFEEAQPKHITMLQRIKKLCMGALLAHVALALCLFSFYWKNFWQDRGRQAAALVFLTTIAYVFIVTNLLEVGENMRFRYETNGLVMITLAIFLQQILDRRRIRRVSP